MPGKREVYPPGAVAETAATGQRTLVLKFSFVFFLLSCEVIWAQYFLQLRSLGAEGGLPLALLSLSPFVVRCLFPLLLVSSGVLFSRLRAVEYGASEPVIRQRALFQHMALFGCFAGSTILLRQTIVGGGALIPITAVWMALGVAGVATLVLTVLPFRLLGLMTAGEWLAGASLSLTATLLGNLSQDGWSRSAAVTAYCVKWLLTGMGHTLTLKPDRIGTALFAVRIDPSCSGYEGIALIAVFSAGWLWWNRTEYRFPAALILIPVGIVLSWLLNVARIVTLILIGHSGHREVAIGGFHTQAGWIVFSLLAVGFCAFSRRLPGMSAASPVSPGQSEHWDIAAPNTAAPYLIPFIAFQAAGMLTTAAGGSEEWSYPIRVAVALAALYWFRPAYSVLRGPFSIAATVAALAVFGVWAAQSLRLPHDNGFLTPVAGLALPWRLAWVAARAAGAVIIAPVVEELAFRGFLLRNIQTRTGEVADFSQADPQHADWLAIGISSLCFGLMHGSRWLEASLAGLVFALAYRRKGSLGEAVFAHALTNGLLLLTILVTGDGRFW